METKKEEIGRSLVAVYSLQSSGNCTPNTCLKIFEVENLGIDFTIYLSAKVLQANLVCRGKKSRETIIMVQMFVQNTQEMMLALGGTVERNTISRDKTSILFTYAYNPNIL